MTESVASTKELANATVELTANEEELVSILVAAADAQRTTVRICGGWVRDKALGRVTKDIDVAVDNCSGAVFAERVCQSLAERGTEPFSRVGVIAANPDQSKHLETATMRLCDVEVDFVNLRSERYADEASRVPTSVDFGTPLEDAMRRDFTLNALFFNVHTRAIEDWTQRGWTDLRDGLLRTPLDPKVTLLDDPLRALRGVRFAARYDFRLDLPLRVACADREVRAALLSKVSRERVGKELKGALQSKARGAARAVDELRRLNLASATLWSPSARGYAGEARGAGGAAVAADDLYDDSEATARDPDSPVWRLAARAVAAHARVAFDSRADDEYKADDVLGWLSALALSLWPLRDCSAFIKKGQQVPLPLAVCRDGLKLPMRDCQVARALIDAAPTCRRLADDWPAEPDRAIFRRDAGLLLIDLKAKWPAAFAVARAADLAALDDVWTDQDDLLLDHPQSLAVVRKYEAVQHAIRDDLRLDRIWADFKFFFDGTSIMADFHVPMGPNVGKLAKIQRDFILMYPNADRDACRDHIQATLDQWKQAEAASPKKRRI